MACLTSRIAQRCAVIFYSGIDAAKLWISTLLLESRDWRDSPYINHFVSADTVVASYTNPQTLNRYSYVTNNPLRYTDPTGHKTCEGQDNGCAGWENVPSTPALARQIIRKHGVKLANNWTNYNVMTVAFALVDVGTQLAAARGLRESSSQAFSSVFRNITFQWEGGTGTCGDAKNVSSGGCTDSANQIRFWSFSGHGQNDMLRMVKTVVHELGHAFNAGLGYAASKDLDHGTLRLDRPFFLHPNPEDPRHYDWQQHPPEMDEDGWTGTETFADMFVAWTYDKWNPDPANTSYVVAAQSWMNNWMP